MARKVDTDDLGYQYPLVLGFKDKRKICKYTFTRIDLTITNPTVYTVKDFMKNYWPGENIQNFSWTAKTLVPGEYKIVNLECKYKQRFSEYPRLAFRCSKDDFSSVINSQVIELHTKLFGPPIK